MSDTDWAEPLAQLLRHGRSTLKVLSPCCGVNGPVRALIALGMPWVSTGDYDTNIDLYHALAKLHAPEQIHVGRTAGNICDVPLASLDSETDCVISGPPCPPHSFIGKRLAHLDARSSVFTTVVSWIVHLATNGRLAFFLLENVCGILIRHESIPEV